MSHGDYALPCGPMKAPRADKLIVGRGTALALAAGDEVGELLADGVVDRRRLELGEDRLPDPVGALRGLDRASLGPYLVVAPVAEEWRVGGLSSAVRGGFAEDKAGGGGLREGARVRLWPTSATLVNVGAPTTSRRLLRAMSCH